jgi:asparagine synthetase B (glutamine-hydrolysing)
MTMIDCRELTNLHFTECDPESFRNYGVTNQPLTPGQYSYAWEEEDGVLLVRDPLGSNNLFFGDNQEGDVLVANRISLLAENGISLDEIKSCPAGHTLRLNQGEIETVQKTDWSKLPCAEPFDLEQFQSAVSERLSVAFDMLRRQFPKAHFVICLSGGLDSSLIAYLAKRHLPRATVACFTYLENENGLNFMPNTPPDGLRGVSEDFENAYRIAAKLELPFLPVFRPPQSVAPAITAAVNLCQDWRDFNVHCAVVNLFLAQDIRAQFPGREVVVLTGDIMNELVCDYHEEIVGDTTYYPQPRTSLKNRRRFFVGGLDAGDREVGVFNAYGLTVCQPFASVADLYMEVPQELLADPDCKKRLNGPLLPDDILSAVNFSKTRAQVGGEGMGTLGVCHKLKIDEDYLKRTWAALFPNELPEATLDLIQFGRYRSTSRRED